MSNRHTINKIALSECRAANTFRIRWLTLACLSVFPLTGNSAPPIAYGSTACPTGFACKTNVTSTGMTQRVLSNSSGTTYFQVTIRDGVTNNGGSFFYDSFVNGSNNNTLGGISAKLDITQTGTHNMTYSTILNLGWANVASSPAIEISEAIKHTYKGASLDYTFNYKQKQSNTGALTGYFYDITEKLIGSSSINGSGSGGSSDKYTFVLRRAKGNYVTKGSISLPGSNDGMMGGGGGGGGGGGMRKASVGSSTGTTNTLQSAFVGDPASFGYDGTIATTQGDPVTGDPQTDPAGNTVYGPDAPNQPSFINDFGGTEVYGHTSTITRGTTGTSNYGNSTAEITSNGNAKGPAAPTSAINVSSGDSMMGMGGAGPAGGTVSWNTGDEVQAIWIGEACSSCANGMGGGMMGGTSSAGLFSFHQYENLSTGAKAASRTIMGSSPFAWATNPFGTTPSL